MFLILNKYFAQSYCLDGSKKKARILQISYFASKCKQVFQNLIFCHNTDKIATIK